MVWPSKMSCAEKERSSPSVFTQQEYSSATITTPKSKPPPTPLEVYIAKQALAAKQKKREKQQQKELEAVSKAAENVDNGTAPGTPAPAEELSEKEKTRLAYRKRMQELKGTRTARISSQMRKAQEAAANSEAIDQARAMLKGVGLDLTPAEFVELVKDKNAGLKEMLQRIEHQQILNSYSKVAEQDIEVEQPPSDLPKDAKPSNVPTEEKPISEEDLLA